MLELLVGSARDAKTKEAVFGVNYAEKRRFIWQAFKC